MRIFKISQLQALFLGTALAFAISVTAAAQTSPPSTNDTQNGGASPSQSAPPTQASPPPAPSTQASPPPAGTQGNQAGAQGNAGSIDDELQLTEDQKQKISAIVDDENKQISAIRDDNSLTLDQKKQKALEVRQAGTPKIKAILTPEQLQKLAEIQQRMREQQQEGQQPPPQNQTPPQ